MTARLLQQPWFLTALRFILGGVFACAGASKLTGLATFADSIESFRLLPSQLIGPLAFTLPVFELVTGLMLVFNRRSHAAALATILMTSVFAMALAQATARGLVVDCGCFGSGTPTAWNEWAALARDVALMSIAWGLYHALPRQSASPERAHTT